MAAVAVRKQRGVAKLGWGILLGMSALLVLHGATWFVTGPETALTNIAERTSLAPEAFRQGSPSAFDVITLTARNASVYEVALGLLSLFVCWKGYRQGARWAWEATWVLVVAFAAVAAAFVLAGGLGGATVGYLGVAAVVLAGQVLAGRGLASSRQATE